MLLTPSFIFNLITLQDDLCLRTAL